MSNARKIKSHLSEAVNAHDLHWVVEFYSPDAVLVSPAGIAEGREQITWVYEQFFKGFPDLHLTTWLETPCDNPVVAEWTLTGTHMGPFLLPDGREAEGTERRITIRGSCMAHVADDLIVTHREYFDQLELYSQLGFGLTKLALPAAQVRTA
ncbi:ester cyclase [Streptosporangium sp. NPDC002721]|uniref:ester cyclase n=1 Tax=Streptosporangium sp. NPDC002721 TaxID=3366188 RepID=UPI0036CF757B